MLKLRIILLCAMLMSCSSIINSSCPQLNVSIDKNAPIMIIKDGKYLDWEIHGLGLGTLTVCRPGEQAGENVNHYYCGEMNDKVSTYYAIQTKVSENGDIGEKNVYEIKNEYDENKNFVKTECRRMPEQYLPFI